MCLHNYIDIFLIDLYESVVIQISLLYLGLIIVWD